MGARAAACVGMNAMSVEDERIRREYEALTAGLTRVLREAPPRPPRPARPVEFSALDTPVIVVNGFTSLL